ncbi:MAG: Isoleucine-tRNA ligase [Candidatus Moranbacteria bacterium GW2011_GWF2_37_7]|nr:MAG: Isoleucine-tRNA ligase [Candidatus Moranbacteria bacterium GW2011_GWF2_37_7]
MQTAKKNNLSTLLTVDEQGRFKPEIIPWAGMFVKDADPLIIEYLKIKNILYKLEKYEHDYPFCWRCQTPLLYYAKKTWFVGMSQLRDELIVNNNKVNWVPGHLKDGRFGEWLSDVKDWAFSRERYWGTPLPVWICQGCGNKKVISSLEDLSQNQTPRNNYFFMRHAEAENNQKGLIGCWPEPKNFKLTKKGEEQVKKAVLKLKKENKGKIDIIFASDLQRTKDTAQAIAEALGVKRVIYDSRLREVIFGSYNGKSSREYHAFFKTKKDRFERAPHGGESWNEVRERIFEFLRKVDDKMEFKNILIVGHGDPLWLLGGAIKHLGYDKQLKLKYPKTGDVWREKYLPSPVDERGNLDLHRPYIDNIDLTCENCKKTMRRVPDVVDVWFDSGAMPFAQWHFPFENKARINKSGLPVGTGLSYPADFICEGIDQTRGWFYTLLAVATLLGKGIPYKNVISNGHVLDKSGQKMSKSKGNVINPWEVIEKYGSDVIRWYFYTINPVGESKLFDEKDLQDRQRNFVMTIINTLNFYKLYGEKSSKLNVKSLKLKSNNILDKWILARFNMLVEEVTKNLDDYDATTAGRAINNFVDDLSNWYIRRSRRRFRDENSTDYKNAAATIRYILISLSKLIAPFTPFLAEYIFHNLEGHEKSVHLENYPRVDKKLIKRELVGEMALVRKIVALGLKLRAQNKLKVRQPLAKLKVKTKELKLKSDLMELIKDELNIKNVLMVNQRS